MDNNNNNGQNLFGDENIVPEEVVENITPTETVENVTPTETVDNVTPTEAVENAVPTAPVEDVVPTEPVEGIQASEPVYYNPENVPTGNAGNGGNNKVKKGISTGKAVGLIGGIAVAVIAIIVCAIMFIPKLFKSDKEVVKSAFEATFESKQSQANAQSYEEKVLGYSDIMDKINSKGGQFDWTGSITGCELAPDIEGVSLQLYGATDLEKELANIYLSCFSNLDSLKLFDIYMEGDKLYIGSPEMFNGYLYVKAGVAEAGNNDKFEKIFNDFSDSIIYEKQGKEKVLVNGAEVNAKLYNVTIKKDALVTLLTSIVDASVEEIKNNPELNEQFEATGTDMNTAIESVKMIAGMIFTKDVTAKVYIKDKEVVKFVANDTLSLMGMSSINYDISFENDANATKGNVVFSVDDQKLGINIDVNDKKTNPSGKISLFAAEDKIDANFTVNNTANGDTDSKNVKIDVVYDSATLFTIDCNREFNKANNEGTGSAKLTIPDAGEISADWKEQYTDIEKGRKYSKTLKDINIKIDNETLITLSSTFTIDSTVSDIPKYDSSAKIYDISSMSESDFGEFTDENAENMQAAMERLSTIFGGLDFMPVDGMDDEDWDDIDDNWDDIDDNGDDIDEDWNDIDDIEDYDSEDMVLIGDEKNVKILGCIDGFEVDYVNPYGISFIDENYNYITYMLYGNYSSVDSILSTSDLFEGEVLIQDKTESMVGGTKVYYAIIKDETFEDYTIRMVVELEDGSFLQAIATYEEGAYTAEELLEAVNPNKYELVEQ